MGSGASRVKTGHFTSTGDAKEVLVGFQPKFIMLMATNGVHAIWQDTMADDSVVKQVDDASSFATTDGVTPSATGFTLGADADVNASAETVHWAAWG